ncbi:Serine/threonine-protein kinase tel1 [Exophiala dermatitidis]
MADVSIVSAVARLEASSQEERRNGLDDLKHILSQVRAAFERKRSRTEQDEGQHVDFDEDDFHVSFELLYKIVSKQKPAFLRATKPTAKNSAASRLEVAAAALRFAVEISAPFLRFKTALSVLDHIVDTLPTADGSWCEPLLNDYLKSFRILLDHAPHVEHMRRKQWQTYVDFALAVLASGFDDGDAESDSAPSQTTSVASRDARQPSLRLSQRGGRSFGRDAASRAEDIILALRDLTSVTNAPVMSRASTIGDSMRDFLNAATRAQEVAFEVLSHVMMLSVTEDIALTQRLLHDLMPAMWRLWSRSALLRDRILAVLFPCRQLFLASSNPWLWPDMRSLEQLLNSLLTEYKGRNPRDIIHFDDMQLVVSGDDAPLQVDEFKPLRTSARALSCWMTLSIIACISLALTRRTQTPAPDNHDDEGAPRKRQKVQSPLEELLQLAVHGVGQEKLVALQVIFFSLDQPCPVEQESLLMLLPAASDLPQEDSNTQTWVYLVFARLATYSNFAQSIAPEIWTQLWDAARRALGVPTTVRAACHIMEVVVRARVLRPAINGTLIEKALFGAGSSGPSTLTDTALIMFITILQGGILNNQRHFEAFCVKIISWLTARWTLPSVLDRLHNAHTATHAKPQLMYTLLVTMCGKPDSVQHTDDWSPVHPLWGLSLAASSNLDFLHYLLGLPASKVQKSEYRGTPTTYQLDPSTAARLTQQIVDLLTGRLKEFIISWQAIHAERSLNIGPDIVEIVAIASLVASVFWVRCGRTNSEATPPAVWSESRELVTRFVLQGTDTNVPQMAVRICGHFVDLHNEVYKENVDLNCAEYLSLIDSALKLVKHSLPSKASAKTSDHDMMEWEIEDSRAMQSGSSSIIAGILRADLPLCPDLEALMARYTMQLTIILQGVKSRRAFDPASASRVAAEIVELDPVLLVASRGAIHDFLSLKTGITRADACRLLERLAKLYLAEELYERCESVQCFVLDVMSGLVGLWAPDEEDDDLAAVVFDIYEWFLNSVLGKNIASPKVLTTMAELLDVLLRVNPSYGGDDLPSPRTSLLKILQISDPLNKYNMAAKLSHIFEKFVLDQHEAIFDDIVENLPTDPDNREGIAVRLHIVAYLGSRWHTVLRRATYHLFETAANVPSTTELARVCISSTCEKLDIGHSSQLFKFFSPQIFYTWLRKDTLSHMPFRAFGYDTLKEMCLDNISEITGQIALRGFSHAEELAQLVGQDWTSLLIQEFAFAIAYALSSETSLPDEERLYNGSEQLVRKHLGSERYLQLLRSSVPDIISRLIISLRDDRGIEKALERYHQTGELAAWQEMASYSTENIQLPLSQQPCFRARCLMDEFKYISVKLNLQMDDIWSPSLVVHVYRQLLDKARPAMGPLHICNIIRKLRIVVSLVGPIALEGYPLQMLLHNLRPYLTMFDCAEDTMGIYRYLLTHGAAYLRGQLSFIAGLGVATFASLTGFIASSQDSTTQEGHYLATMTKAQEFRAFLRHYLETFDPLGVTAEALTTFRQIVQHAKAIAQPGNSSTSTSEGSLLRSLLEDQSSEHPLLTNLDFDVSMEILCRGFSPATDTQDDILENDDEAARFSPTLSSVLKRLRLDEASRLWAAQGIGRGYIARGLHLNVKELLTSAESTVSLRGHDLTPVSSYTGIVRFLSDLLWSADFSTATFAEKTLQLIFSSLSKAVEQEVLDADFGRHLVADLRLETFPCPPIRASAYLASEGNLTLSASQSRSWAATLLQSICQKSGHDPVLSFLEPLISADPTCVGMVFPYAVHLALASDFNTAHTFRETLSQAFAEILQSEDNSSRQAQELVLRTILYLRECRISNEENNAQRNLWLDVDFGMAAVAATKCQMWHEALLFLELQHSQAQLQTGRLSRRSMVLTDAVPTELVSKIYENVDDPDFFYGKHQEFDLQSIIHKLNHEGASQKSLSFQSAMLDSQLMMNEQDQELGTVALTAASTLKAANMQGIAEAVSQYFEGFGDGAQLSGGHWDVLTANESVTDSRNVTDLLRGMLSASTTEVLNKDLDRSLLSVVDKLRTETTDKSLMGSLLSHIAVLSEAKQIVRASTPGNLESIISAIERRNEKTKFTEFRKLSPMLVGREYAFNAIRKNAGIRATMSVDLPQALLFEIRVARQSLKMATNYDVPQFGLNRTIYLTQLSRLASDAGVKVDIAVQYDLARTFWAQNETSASIEILQTLKQRDDIAKQAVIITKADLLTDLGHKIAEARLEKPDEIIDRYLLPAFKELHGRAVGSEAGRVFHNFAAFCDMQLQDPDNLDDFTRISKIRDRKMRDIQELQRMHLNGDERQQKQLRSHLVRAKEWFKLDDQEWKRVSQNRQTLILQCLENYLLSMRASDEYPNDTLRFLALWLNQADSKEANKSVRKHLGTVPSYKFAPLVNQLSSRLLDIYDDFQQLLMELMFRICSDHPFHSLYQVFAASKSKSAKADEVAVSRNAAANKLAELIAKKSVSSPIWVAIHNCSIALYRVTQERAADKDLKTGAKFPLRKLLSAQKLEQTLSTSAVKIPPPTMNIPLRPDRDYSSVPVFSKFEPYISIAGGVSAPKIVTMVATDGSRHKMLLKGGNDDLRQDAIMEQVFEQVSNLLREHRTTRQRNLGIRTYKVIPLNTNAGIIEFVKDTIPLHDYLLPAHTRYFPKDYKPNRCRKEIADAQNKPLDQRIRAYRTVVANFHPVMRFFFMEHFPDPDDWFYKRLNYSRSTAAVSILGHVLGLGDRHGHNILLDEKSGDVVHIDLGVAFEAGRVLPVPEVVPFRLTRDLVDGMGLTGVEGVFRRCCNFTLEALRRDQEAIMTILDVLRYDPLYSWSISPLRLQKMQENHGQADDGTTTATSGGALAGGGGAAVDLNIKRDAVGEPSEADRALTVVAKKLSKSLSVEATVNELIRQATDERNLAVLYCGWAAYA